MGGAKGIPRFHEPGGSRQVLWFDPDAQAVTFVLSAVIIGVHRWRLKMAKKEH
jgi:hypothetical protein